MEKTLRGSERTSVTQAMRGAVHLDAFGSGDVARGGDEIADAKIRLGDPETIDLQNQLNQLLNARSGDAWNEPSGPSVPLYEVTDKDLLRSEIEKMKTPSAQRRQDVETGSQKTEEQGEKTSPEAAEIVETPALTNEEVTVAREALKQPLYARLKKMDRARIASAAADPSLIQRWGREFKMTALLLGGVSVANATIDFGPDFVRDVMQAASDVAQRFDEPESEKSHGEPSSLDETAKTETQDMEVYLAEVDEAVGRHWAQTFDGIDYIVRLSPQEREYELKGGGTAHSTSLEQNHDAAGFYDSIDITPTRAERTVTKDFWRTMSRQMALESPNEPVHRVVEFHSPDAAHPLLVSDVVGGLHPQEIPNFLTSDFPHTDGNYSLDVQLDGKTISTVNW